MPKPNIQVLVANHCLACLKVLRIIYQMKDQMPGLCVEVVNLDEQSAVPEGLDAVIVPATYVNGRLFAYGEFEPFELITAVGRFSRVETQTHN